MEPDIEPIHPQFDAQLEKDPSDTRAWKAYADWLWDEGDPRGELMRAQAGPPSDEKRLRMKTLIDRYWRRWMGSTPSTDVTCDWEHGFVRELTVHRPPAGETSLRGLFSLRSLHFLRKLKVATDVALEGIEGLPVLSRLELRALSARTVRSLEEHSLPALRQVHVEPGNALTAEDLGGLRDAPWLAKLSVSIPGLVSPRAADVLLGGPEVLAKLGDRLFVSASEEVLKSHRSRLLSRYPGMILSPPSLGRGWHGPHISKEPRHAPKNFRELPPVGYLPETDHPGKRSRDLVMGGSGLPFAEHRLAKGWYSRCWACSGYDTLCVWANYSTQDGRYEVYVWEMCEYFCRECGRFTYYEKHYER